MNARLLKAGLATSLALNLFLLGGIAGGAYRWFSARQTLHAAAAAQPHTLRAAARDLSPQRQQQFLDVLRQARRDSRPFAQQAREGRRDVLRLIAAPEPDRAALDAALARTREADRAVRERVEAGVADFAVTLTPAERAAFAQSLRSRGQWREPQPASAASPTSAGG